MRRFKIVTCIIFILLLNWKCEKHVFGKITVKGSIKDWWTNQPIESKIEVSALPGNSGFVKSRIVSIATFFNEGDGGFNQSMKSYKSDKYRIDFSSLKTDTLSGFPVQFSKDFSLKNKATMDFGEMLNMPHLFICKITIKNVSNSNYVLSFNSNPSAKILGDTILYKSFSFTKEFFEQSGHKFSFGYSVETNPNGSSKLMFADLIFEIGNSDHLEGSISF